MDLALELGITDDDVLRMPESSIRAWMTYARQRMLPQRRLEVHLAQLTLAVAAGNGNKSSLHDFLVDPRIRAEVLIEEDGSHALADMAGVAVVDLN